MKKSLLLSVSLLVFTLAGGLIYNIWHHRLSLACENNLGLEVEVDITCRTKTIQRLTLNAKSNISEIVYPRCEGAIGVDVIINNRPQSFKVVKYAPSGLHEISIIIKKENDISVLSDGKVITASTLRED